ncbi:MAG: hypothetical protein RIE08_00950 [Acidimicrobiales bacterium]
MSDTPQGPGWWLASDGRWYAPELHPDYRKQPVENPTPPAGEGWPTSPPTEQPATVSATADGGHVRTTRDVVAGVVALVAAVLLAAGALLDWADRVTIRNVGSSEVSGFDSNGIGVLLCAGILAVGGAMTLTGFRHVFVLVSMLAAALTATALVGFSMYDIQGPASDRLAEAVASVAGLDPQQVSNAGVDFDLATGIWMALAGGVAGVVGSLLLRTR